MPHREIDDKPHYFSPPYNCPQLQRYSLKTLVCFCPRRKECKRGLLSRRRAGGNTEQHYLWKMPFSSLFFPIRDKILDLILPHVLMQSQELISKGYLNTTRKRGGEQDFASLVQFSGLLLWWRGHASPKATGEIRIISVSYRLGF